MRRVMAGRRCGWRQCGAALAEFVVTLPALLLLGLGGYQGFLAYHAKTVLDYAAFEAARRGAVAHAQIEPMREELGLRLAPVFGGDGSAGSAVAAVTRGMLDTRDPRYTQIEVLNPTREAFADFGVVNAQTGRRELPNDHMRFRSSAVGATSGVSVQDANLLKIRVTYGYRLTVPVVGRAVAWALAKLDPGHGVYYAARRLPLESVALVRLQSAAWEGGNASAGGGVSGGAPPQPGQPPAPGGGPLPPGGASPLPGNQGNPQSCALSGGTGPAQTPGGLAGVFQPTPPSLPLAAAPAAGAPSTPTAS